MPAHSLCGPWPPMRRDQHEAGSTSAYLLRRNIFGDSDSLRHSRTC